MLVGLVAKSCSGVGIRNFRLDGYAWESLSGDFKLGWFSSFVSAIIQEGTTSTNADYNELKKEIDKIKSIYSDISDEKLKLSQIFLSSVRRTYIFIGGVITFVFTILVFLGCKYAFPRVLKKTVEEEIKRNEHIKTVSTRLEEACRETNIALARLCLREGLSRYKEKNLKRAIELTERALKFIKKNYPSKAPESKEEEILWGIIHGNLAYYYAEEKDVSKYNQALEYAQDCLVVGRKHNIMSLIDDYLFTVFSYDVKDTTIKENASKIFQSWGKKLLKTYGIGSNYKDYKVFFKK